MIMNKVKKISEECHRIEQMAIEHNNNPVDKEEDIQTSTTIFETEHMIKFINSLQEEPVSIWHDASEKSNEPEEVDNPCKIGKNLQKDIVIVLNGQRHRQVLHKGCFSKKECKEKCSLYERCQRCCIDLCMIFFHDPHCHFVEEPVSDDLEEVSKKYSSCIYLEEVLSDDDKEVLRGRLINTFKAGAQWQKEKDAILPKVWNRKNLDDFSYQTAYDLSNDWAKETPTWDDVEKACKLGANWQKEKDNQYFAKKTIETLDEVFEDGRDNMKQQMIAKACKYLQEHKEEVETEDNGISGWISDEFIEKFKKYMNG